MNHEDVNPATGEVEDKHFWLVEHDGLVFGSGWHHDESGSWGEGHRSALPETKKGPHTRKSVTLETQNKAAYMDWQGEDIRISVSSPCCVAL